MCDTKLFIVGLVYTSCRVRLVKASHDQCSSPPAVQCVATVCPSAVSALKQQWFPPLEMDTRLVDLHWCTKVALSWIQPYDAGSDRGAVVLTHIFIDGASGAQAGLDVVGQAASGLGVIHELGDGTFRFAGFPGMLMDLEPYGDGFSYVGFGMVLRRCDVLLIL